MNSSCHLVDWQHGFGWTPVGASLRKVSKLGIINSDESQSVASARGSDDFELRFQGMSFQMKIQEMEKSEFSQNHPKAARKLTIPRDLLSVQYFQISPTHTDVNAKLESDRSQFYIWDSLKNHWHILYEENKQIVLKNTKSGLLVIAHAPDYNFSVPFALAGACFFIILIGSFVFFHFQPQEWTKITRGFNEYILRRPL